MSTLHSESADSDTIGGRIRAARRRRGLSLRQVAEHLDVSIPFLSDVERNRRSVTLTRAAQLAIVLGIEATSIAPLDAATLDVAIADLAKLGGCDRAIARLNELRKAAS